MQILLALALLLGAGGVTVASDAAVPGDALFPVDRAVEQVRIAFANNEKKNELRLRFAEERVAEFEEIIDEESESLADDSSSDDVVELGLSRAVATVFTNQTVVEVTYDNVPEVFTTAMTERAAIIEDIVTNYDVTSEEVDALLVIEIEDRESTPEDLEVDDDSDDDDDTVRSNQRVERGLESALEYLAELETILAESGVEYDLTALTDRINSDLDNLGTKTNINIKVSEKGASFIKAEIESEDGTETKTEIKQTGGGNVIIKSRDGTEKVDIKIKKDGEIEIKTQPDNKGKGNNNDLFNDDDDDEDDEMEGLTEVEVTIVGETALVEVEYNDEDDEFVLETTDTAAIITEVATRYGVSEAEVAAVIEFEDMDDDDDSDDEDDSDDDSDDASGDDEDSNDDDTEDDSSDTLEIEVEVEDGVATVEIKIDGVENEFTLDMTDQDEIIAEIAELYPTLEPADIEAAMEFEVKD